MQSRVRKEGLGSAGSRKHSEKSGSSDALDTELEGFLKSLRCGHDIVAKVQADHKDLATKLKRSEDERTYLATKLQRAEDLGNGLDVQLRVSAKKREKLVAKLQTAEDDRQNLAKELEKSENERMELAKNIHAIAGDCLRIGESRKRRRTEAEVQDTGTKAGNKAGSDSDQPAKGLRQKARNSSDALTVTEDQGVFTSMESKHPSDDESSEVIERPDGGSEDILFGAQLSNSITGEEKASLETDGEDGLTLFLVCLGCHGAMVYIGNQVRKLGTLYKPRNTTRAAAAFSCCPQCRGNFLAPQEGEWEWSHGGRDSGVSIEAFEASETYRILQACVGRAHVESMRGFHGNVLFEHPEWFIPQMAEEDRVAQVKWDRMEHGTS